jgi:hypothetical protein
MKKILSIGFGLLILTSNCAPTGSGNSSKLNADEPGDSIFGYLDDSDSPFLYVSLPATATNIQLCPSKTTELCKSDISKLIPVESVEKQSERLFFKTVAPLSITDGMYLTMSAKKDDKELVSTIQFNKNDSTDTDSDAANDTGDDQSSGTGGVTGEIVENQVHKWNDLESQFRVFAPTSNSANTPQALVVYLHGKTGSNFASPASYPRVSSQYGAYGQPRPTVDQAFYERTLNESSMWNNTVIAAILTPSTNGSFITWSTALSGAQRNANADYIHDLVTSKILPKYNIDLNKIYFVGQSGGGVFLGNTFIPRHGEKYKGGAIMLCGSETPRRELDFNPSEEFKLNYKIHIETTNREQTGLVPRIKEGRSSYEKIFGKENVSYRNEGNGTHCQFVEKSQPQIIERVISSMQN